MTARRALFNTAHRAVRAIGLAAILLGLSASMASAAPVLELELENDPLADEVQRVTVKATGGAYRLNFGSGGPGASETADIAASASAGEVQAALNAIANISSGGGSVDVSGGPGDALGANPYLVTFSGGPLEMTDVDEMTVSAGTTPLSGGSKLALIRTLYGGGVARGDLRHDYTVKIKNNATTSTGIVEVGDTLTCVNSSWFPSEVTGVGPAFSFEWRADGALIGGASDSTYVVAPADAGKAIQCIVIGTNVNAKTKFASLNPVVVAPQVAAGPPKSSDRTAAGSRPTVTGTGSAMRTCNIPANWEVNGLPFNNPANFSFQWLRNSEKVSGANSGTYTPSLSAIGTGTWASGSTQVTVGSTTSGLFEVGERVNGNGIRPDTTITAIAGSELTLSAPTTAAGNNAALVAGEDAGVILQCEVVGNGAGGSTVGISNNSPVVSVPQPPNNGVAQTPLIQDPNITIGPVTAEVTLPEGQETRVLKTTGAGWSCVNQAPVGIEPARATCSRSDGLAPQASYPSLIVSAALGADIPDISTATTTVSGGGAPTVSAEETLRIGPARPFEITVFETKVPDPEGNEETQAGAHPIQAQAEFGVSRKRTSYDKNNPTAELGYSAHLGPIENTKHINTHTPRGFVGNALAVPELCPSVGATLTEPTQCPRESIVGGISIRFFGVGLASAPIFSMEPEYGLPAQFAFPVSSVNGVYTFYPELRADDSYAISILSAPSPSYPPLLDVNATLCGYGAKTNPTGRTVFQGCKQPGEADPDGAGPLTGANPVPLVTLPTRCAGEPPVTELEIDSWQNPGDYKSRSFTAPQITGCEKVEFEPSAEVRPLSAQADSPSGLDVELTIPTNGLEGKDAEGNLDPEALAQANMKTARVSFPEGMAINPSAGHGLGSCSAAQVKMGTNEDISCPDASKIGTIEIDTPIIRETLTGGLYIGKQSEAPAGSLIGLYMVFESKRDGIIIKIPGRVQTNPVTGQLVSVFDDILDAPFSRAKFSFNQGPRASLITPPRCGSYAVKAEMVPWTIKDLDNPTPDEIVTQHTSFDITQGPNGGPCPDGALRAGFNAGTTSPLAGQPSPFTMRLTRDDGTQRFTALNLKTPPGLVADLRGVPYCSEAALASISGAVETGQAQITNPSCPAASLIGHASAGAGAGPHPFYVETGKAYLAGPYKGAPLSLALVTPAVAGPLDLGNVVVRTALHVDPVTAQISAVSDPIPTILHGVLLNARDIRVAIDRPGFTRNPTSCEETAVHADVSGDGGGALSLASRFQVDGCRALGFKPRVNLRLVGGTKRGAHPSLRAVVRPRPGDANIRRAAVTMPNSAFLDQENIRTICTRVQWAADNCPKAAIYGFATAWSPLLDEPLKGPVYLRSSNNLLPDLVADLRGPAHQPIKIEAAFRTDSIRGGIRSTLDFGPDAPVSHFLLRMQGGKRKGLIVNSRDICRGTNRAHSRMVGHNGRRENSRPKVHAANCGKARKGAKGKGGKRSNLSQLKAVR